MRRKRRRRRRCTKEAKTAAAVNKQIASSSSSSFNRLGFGNWNWLNGAAVDSGDGSDGRRRSSSSSSQRRQLISQANAIRSAGASFSRRRWFDLLLQSIVYLKIVHAPLKQTDQTRLDSRAVNFVCTGSALCHCNYRTLYSASGVSGSDGADYR